ncbi:MAG: prephenate dehydrogenase/arogenate dehydrogenase family protein [Chloroflexi bacterium]|nr:prephenate dehydrogenase/arogenate dehydrogenase family protein [Chloroflexota bacterium]
MPTQITLIGLGRRGGSLGLALKSKSRELTITGHDREPGIARVAQARGAVDRIEWNLPRACEKADLVVLAVPIPAVRETFSAAAESFRSDCVVTSLAPLLAPPVAWAAEHLPPTVHFVAGNLAANPDALPDAKTGLDGARADLFEKGLWALAPARNCAPAAVKLVVDLAALLGAVPFFVAPDEHDGLSAGVDALPALTAVALVRAVTQMPGWRERRKMTDRDFAAVTAPADADPAGRRATLDLNRDNVLRHLDALLAELNALRAQIDSGGGGELEQLLAEAGSARAQWLNDRMRGDWRALEVPATEMPKPGDFLGNLIGFRRRSQTNEKKKGS